MLGNMFIVSRKTVVTLASVTTQAYACKEASRQINGLGKSIAFSQEELNNECRCVDECPTLNTAIPVSRWKPEFDA